MANVNAGSPKAAVGYHAGWVSYFAVVHLVGIYGTYYALTSVLWQTVLFTIVYYFYGHLSITILAHRYYAHKAFRFVAKWLHWLFIVGFMVVGQGGIVWWSAQHILHHASTDRPGFDPHTPKEGFWWAHVGWVMSRRGLSLPRQAVTFLPKSDDPRERFAPGRWQSASATRAFLLGVVMALVVPTIVCSAWGDPIGGLLVGGFARLLFQYHLTWVVNSVGHTYGEHVGGSATNQRGVLGIILAVLTVGESNHGAHHDHPASYRIGRGPGQIDPGAWVLERLASLGLVADLKEG